MAGDGSIYRRDERTWVAQLSIGGRGGRRYVRRNARTRAEAREALDELRAEHRAGVRRSRLTTGAYLEQWVRDVRNIRPSTRHGYAAAIEYHLAPSIGHVRLFDLSPLDVEGMLSRLSSSMSAKHLRNVHAVLRRALTHAVRTGLVTRNVAAKEYVEAPRIVSEEPDALTRAEVDRLLSVVSGERLEALFVTAIGTGLRQGELLGLSWEDVQLGGTDAKALPGRPRVGREGDRSVLPAAQPGSAVGEGEGLAGGRAGTSDALHLAAHVTVRRELVRRDGRYFLEEPKTERSKRAVPLAPAVVDALRAHRERMIAEGFIPTATGPVFVNTTGGALNGSWLTHHHYALLERAGIRRLPFKNLRTTYGSRLFEAGVSSRRIADLMGHTRERTTQRHYIDTAGASETDAIEAVSALLARESPRESRETPNTPVEGDEMGPIEGESGSGGRIRTYDQAVNSRRSGAA